MGVFSFLRPQKRKVQPVKEPETLARPYKTASLVLIDYKNVRTSRAGEYIGIRWNTLRALLEGLVQGSSKTIRYAYRRVDPGDTENQERARLIWKEHGYEFETYVKDIDSWIASDLWRLALDVTDDAEVRKFRIVLVSGDRDFARGIEHVLKRFRTTHEVEFIVCSWGDKLSPDLLRHADKFIDLRTVPNLRRAPSRSESLSAAD